MTTFEQILAEPALPPARLTVDQYHQMIDKGILEEGSPFELLNGIITPKDRAKTQIPQAPRRIAAAVVDRHA